LRNGINNNLPKNCYTPFSIQEKQNNMKKKMNEVKGLLLSNKQMKGLMGGRQINVCPSGCSTNQGYGECYSSGGQCNCKLYGLSMVGCPQTL